MTAVILLALGLGGLSAGILVGRYYVPDDRALKRSARHADAYVKTINLLLARDKDAAVDALVGVVAENVDDVEPYFALGALFRNRGEWERAIRVHQAIELREQSNRKQCLRARYQLGLDFRAAGMPRRATRAMEDCLADDPKQLGALRALCSLYEEQGRFAEAAATWNRIEKLDETGDSQREHHLLCAAAQRAIESSDHDSAKNFLKDAQRIDDHSPHFLVASAELAAAKGNWGAASERLRQALTARPELVSYLAGPLRAAELELQAANSDEERAASVVRLLVAALEQVQRDVGADPILALAAAEIQSEVDEEEALSNLQRLTQENPGLLPARVVAGRLALASGNAELVSRELDALVGEEGVLESALDGSWVCATCEHPDEFYFWRCHNCRQWGSARLEMGRSVRQGVASKRERRTARRSGGLLSGDSLPHASLESGMSRTELQIAGRRRSALSRAGSWISGAIGSVRGTNQKSDDDLD